MRAAWPAPRESGRLGLASTTSGRQPPLVEHAQRLGQTGRDRAQVEAARPARAGWPAPRSYRPPPAAHARARSPSTARTGARAERTTVSDTTSILGKMKNKILEQFDGSRRRRAGPPRSRPPAGRPRSPPRAAAVRVSIVKSTSACLTESLEKARWWSTSTMLPPCSAMIVAIRTRLPGLSGTPTRRRTSRWVRTRPRRITAESRRLSMLPPHSTRPTLAAAEALGIAGDRGEAGGAGALGHGLLDLEQLQDRGLDRRLLDQQHVVDQALDDREGELARLLDRDALGDRRPAGHGRQAAQAAVDRRIERRLDADDLDLRACSALAAVAMPPISPPPPIGTTSTSSSGAASSISSASVPWPAITAGVVERMDEGQALALPRAPRRAAPPPRRPRPRSTTRAPNRRVFSTFTNGVWQRHHDRRRDAEAPGVIGHALRVVAGRHRDHAGGRLLRRQLRQPVQRAALLERGGVLQVLELQPELGAGDLRERARRQAGRRDDLARQPRPRPPATSSSGDGHGNSGRWPRPSRSSSPSISVHVLDRLAGRALDQIVDHADQDRLARDAARDARRSGTDWCRARGGSPAWS